MLRNLRFGLLALANDMALFLAIAPPIDPRLQIDAVAGASLGGKCTNKTCRLSKKPPAEHTVVFGAKQCQPYHPHKQTINICVVYATSTTTTTATTANIYNNQRAEVGSSRAANVWLQVAFWAKPHSQLIATTATTAPTTTAK